ncbi:HAD family phosphatase [Streptomyces sp. ISL-100]|uniref:HAD family hydrolase n=1 Tax=Streptomyces sp. ISL-100 TaxID=2819173 RepID=UPI001BEB4560|nr:HAD-IB family hydrolase [Streptomyces sp. ISL-100]MBT2399301.1 HAD-IB family hydrolase [Streptomyces sp. ISL-100]
MNAPRRAVAFFDVDETLITVKSMSRFLAFYWDREGEDQARFLRARSEHLRAQAAGVPRSRLNRSFYRHFRGASGAVLARAGRDWFAAEQARGGLFHQPTVDALLGHRRAGDLIALVSGSFLPCLAPIAEALHADVVLCVTAEEHDGILTGEIDTPVIGARKAGLARQTMGDHHAAPRDCHAYGDHASDVDLLRAVGHPVVVGDDPLLNSLVRSEGWRRLAGVAAPSPVGSHVGRPRTGPLTGALT